MNWCYLHLLASPATEPAQDIGLEKKLILRGALAGAVAGVLAFVFARIFAEPVINQAISYESGRDVVIAALDKAAGLPAPPPGPDTFSRTIQANVGIGTRMIAFGAPFAVACRSTSTPAATTPPRPRCR